MMTPRWLSQLFPIVFRRYRVGGYRGAGGGGGGNNNCNGEENPGEGKSRDGSMRTGHLAPSVAGICTMTTERTETARAAAGTGTEKM